MISKVTTLGRPKVLENLFFLEGGLEEQTSEGSREFFDIGSPMTKPVSPSGTILLSLERSFLIRNEAFFLWASIPDNGGIRLGLLPYLHTNCYRSVRLGFDVFSRLLDQIDLLSNDCKQAVLEKRPSAHFCNAIRGMVDENVIEGMLVQPMPAARRIEFCLSADFTISEADIKAVQIPNTYRSFLSPKRAKFSSKKLFYYNPRDSVFNI